MHNAGGTFWIPDIFILPLLIGIAATPFILHLLTLSYKINIGVLPGRQILNDRAVIPCSHLAASSYLQSFTGIEAL